MSHFAVDASQMKGDWEWTLLVVVTVVSILVANCSIAHLYYTKQSNERLTDQVRKLQETP